MTKNKQNELLKAPGGDDPVDVQKQTADAIQKLSDGVLALSPEVREQLSRLGVTFPAGDIAAAVAGKHKWGIRCVQCNSVALFFVGSTFVDLNTKHKYDRPQPHMKISTIPWTQDKSSSEIDRVNPVCQHCGHPVDVQNGCFRFDRRLIELEGWESSRDAAFSKAALEELRAKTQTGDTFTNTSGQQVSLADRVPRAIIEKKASEWLAENNPVALEDIRQVDQALSSTGGLVGSLAKPPKG